MQKSNSKKNSFDPVGYEAVSSAYQADDLPIELRNHPDSNNFCKLSPLFQVSHIHSRAVGIGLYGRPRIKFIIYLFRYCTNMLLTEYYLDTIVAEGEIHKKKNIVKFIQ